MIRRSSVVALLLVQFGRGVDSLVEDYAAGDAERVHVDATMWDVLEDFIKAVDTLAYAILLIFILSHLISDAKASSIVSTLIFCVSHSLFSKSFIAF